MGRIDTARGFLGRLARDVRGNTIALMAAVMIPLAGLVGGGVDMSRLYLTKTRLQQACDAGVLAGRKAMAAGAWTAGTNNGSTNDKAEKMFGANFKSGQYGTNSLTKEFTETNGTVNGTSSVRVPMTIMKVFGMQPRTLRVNCTAKMELPNTDVMFVLDVTYSMGCAPSATSDSCSQAAVGSRRIDGLRHAVQCFYEALMRVQTPELCTPDGVGTNDPTATTATTTAQVRLGFVPYGVNVNVGRLLPHNAVADDWTYQSRTPTIGTAHSYVIGALNTATSGPGALNWNGTWTNPTSGDSFWNTGSWNTFNTLGGNNNDTYPMNDGRSLTRKNTGATNSNQCLALNIYGNQKMAGVKDSATGTAGTTYTSSPTDQNPPVWVSTNPQNPNVQNQSTGRTRSNTADTGYRYQWVNPGGGNGCYLQSATKKPSTSYTQTQSGTGTKPITWTDHANAVTGWTYKPMRLTVSGLKGSGSTWNNSVTFANMASVPSGPALFLSNESTARQVPFVGDLTVAWDGCIEEAKTFQATDTDFTNDWTTIPGSALDMNVNLVPSSALGLPTFTNPSAGVYTYSPGSYWGPMLAGQNNTSPNGGVVWARTNSGGSATRSDVTTTSDQDGKTPNFNYYCTSSPARALAEYRTAGTTGDTNTFVGYINALAANDLGTYHDIGMLWGGRLLSPLGVFAGSNATAATGGAIQRHLIFMTDGNTRTVDNNYNAYGLSYYNRYQTSFDPTEDNTNNITNERLIALCTAIKNMNITLWVVSYGSSVDTTTQNRLKQCATQPSTTYFVSATNTAALTAQFKTIAAKISELRLTS